MADSKIRCIAVDDEPLALALVSGFISQTPFLELVGKFENAIEALSFIHEKEVDLIFLDIQMPGLTGMELARVLEGHKNKNRPKIIFTTAYDQFALEGYKVNALDYLLKPFGYDEFLRASTKAYQITQSAQFPPQVSVPQKDYLFLKVEYQLVKVFLKDIICIEGYKDYVKVHLIDKPHPLLSLTSLKNLEEILPRDQFMRVHRSYIVSLDHIESVTKNTINLGGISIAVSDHYKDGFLKFMEKWIY
ncbi:Two-component system response regulator [Lunatimonas lonarensis]|uniref:Two-component system response regulator n=1 Tax=Lunatimonas lonarensis TaxID=1232681 RepID=R7ZWP4_9BACT|nr:LytTR family DNA-binding domain-containing protein [Lunatimonas lonarensis]EON78565.1 Two-component system response regulator [Lunatimonas lonarensis]